VYRQTVPALLLPVETPRVSTRFTGQDFSLFKRELFPASSEIPVKRVCNEVRGVSQGAFLWPFLSARKERAGVWWKRILTLIKVCQRTEEPKNGSFFTGKSGERRGKESCLGPGGLSGRMRSGGKALSTKTAEPIEEAAVIRSTYILWCERGNPRGIPLLDWVKNDASQPSPPPFR